MRSMKPVQYPIDDLVLRLAVQQQVLRFVHGLMLEDILPDTYRLEIHRADTGLLVLPDAQSLRRYLYQQKSSVVCDMVLCGPDGDTTLTDPIGFANSRAREWARTRFGAAFQDENWDQVVLEMADSFRNECYAIEAQRTLFGELRRLFGDKDNAFEVFLDPAGLAACFGTTHDLDSLLLQIASFSGHRIHPFSKLRMMSLNPEMADRFSLSLEDLKAYAPEFAPDTPIGWIAVRSDAMTVSVSRRVAMAYGNYVRTHFPVEMDRWCANIRAQNKVPEEFVPVPIHPLQVPVIGTQFSKHIADGVILPDLGAVTPMRPMVSMRTMIKPHDPHAPQIKTTINMQMTSVIRTINPSRTFNAPILSDFLLDVLEREPDLARVLRIVTEPVSAFWGQLTDTEDDMYRDGYQLCAVFKANPTDTTQGDETRIPLNALFTKSPLSSDRILIDVMRAAGVDSPAAAVSWFKAYIEIVLTADLGLLMRYGIGLESHQQNIDMVFGADGWPRASVYRDINGGLEIYEPLLSASGIAHAGRLHPVSRGLLQSLDLPLSQTLHCTFFSHMIPLVWIVSQAFSCAEGDLLPLIRAKVVSLLDEAPNHFKGERDAPIFRQALAEMRNRLLEQPYRSKRMLSMRIMQTQDISFTQFPNPLSSVVR